MKKFFTAGRVDKLLKFIQKQKIKPALPEEVLAAVGKAEDYDLPSMYFRSRIYNSVLNA